MKRSIHGLTWVLLAVCAFLLWPERWGGSMTYVITNGSSMAPTWRAGDLAVLRSADDYRVGEVAAYRSTDIKSIVMHRITGETEGGYRFQGDANDHLDPETVTEQQLLGKLVLRVPEVGKALGWLFQPLNLALAGGALLLLLPDRRREEQPVTERAPLRIAVHDVELPPGTVVADVLDPAQLHALAERYDRPVLVDEATQTQVVVEAGVAYRHVAVNRIAEPGSIGRDWAYGVDADVIALLPRPRRDDVQTGSGVELSRLLRLSRQ